MGSGDTNWSEAEWCRIEALAPCGAPAQGQFLPEFPLITLQARKNACAKTRNSANGTGEMRRRE